MTLREKTWEEETLDLIKEAKLERQRVEQRLATVQRALDKSNKRIESLQGALEAYREHYNIPNPEDEAARPAIAEAYRGLSLKEMVTLWADQHDGEVKMSEASLTLTLAGLWKDKQKAAGSLYSTISRMPDFEKVSRGVYCKKRPASESIGAVYVVSNGIKKDPPIVPDFPHNGDGAAEAWDMYSDEAK